MGLMFRSLTSILVLVAAAIGFTSAATAEPASSSNPSGYEPIAETFNRTFFENDPDFFRNQTLGRKLDLILGIGSFPDDEIRQDGELVDKLYKDTLEQQVSSDFIIRTRDLPNPYGTSVLDSPSIKVNSSPVGREFVFESLPPR